MVAFLSRVTAACLAALLLAAALVVDASAEDQTMTAVVAIAPPYVMKDGDQLTGFSVDLWNAVAARLNVKTTFLPEAKVRDSYEALRTKQADIVIAPSVYSIEIDKEFDYSFPILNAGYLVVVPDIGQSTPVDNPFLDLLQIVLSPTLLMWLGFVVILILVPAHVIWFLDRGSNDSVCPDRSYFPGILHAMVWSATAMVSQVQQLPRYHIARAFGLVWMFVGVVFIAFYTAQITAKLTVQQIRGPINGLQDLAGKRVAVLADSHAARIAADAKAKVHPYPTFAAVFDAVETHKVAAAVVNAPVARYYASHDGAGKLVAVGDEFRRQDLGFVMQANSAQRRPIDEALVGLKEDGTYDQLYTKWFGGT